MRKQYHFRPSARGLYAWDVDRLIALAQNEAVEQVPIADIRELDDEYWFGHGYRPTVRAVVEHMRLVNEVDLDYPIVLDPDGAVLDGMHRAARALLEGRLTVAARRLPKLPHPDYTDVQPDELPY